MSGALGLAFWVCLAAGIYPYAIYPCLAAALSMIWSRSVRREPITPKVTVVISAYNEVRCIEATVCNKLAQDYPADLLDVMVASDGSTDGTDDVLRQLAGRSSRLAYFRQQPRRGKTVALNSLVERAGGEIIVFSDANSMYRPDTVRRLVENFADPSVGYVTGKMIYVNPDGSTVGDGCSAYMRYENWLRGRETLLGSVVGVDGGVDAVRRVLYRPMEADQLPDFVLPLRVVDQDYRVVFEPLAQLCEDTLTDSSAEFRMRVRVSLRSLWALLSEASLLNPLRRPLFAWQLWSHKALRYLSFLPLAAACVLNVILATVSNFYLALLGVQLLVWLAVWAGARGSRLSAARFAYYFALLNAASAVAFVRFVRGHKQVLWQPRTG
jgi:cellulose synthase/poly-beta-1,6-N-acetylglucosamine synthase-like glycosyltransferase